MENENVLPDDLSGKEYHDINKEVEVLASSTKRKTLTG